MVETFRVNGLGRNILSRPAIVNIGAIFSFDSTIGRPAAIAIKEAVKDVNSNWSVLHGTKLHVDMQNSNCSGFFGMVGDSSSPLPSKTMDSMQGVLILRQHIPHVQQDSRFNLE